MNRFAHLRGFMCRDPWAIDLERGEAVCCVLERRLSGQRMPAEEIAAIKGRRQPNGILLRCPEADIEAAITALEEGRAEDLLKADAALAARLAAAAAGEGPQASSSDFGPEPRAAAAQPANPGTRPTSIAVLSVMGIVAQHASVVDDISGPGGTSTDRVGAALDAAMRDPTIKAVVLNMDSPGGGVSGVQELATQILRSRDQKPIVAQVNSLAASAAYWIASACTEIVVTPGGRVGSIGVYMLHEDISDAAGQAGVKYTFVSAGKFKTEGNPYEPLGDEATRAIQSSVDEVYGAFTAGVAKGRAVPVAQVRDGMGEGRVVGASDAVRMGMADRIGTLGETLRRLASARPAPAQAQAADVGLEPTAGPVAPPEPPEAPTAAAAAATAASDEFRRRRHANRMRAA